MAEEKAPNFILSNLAIFGKSKDILFAVGVISIIFLLIFPIPSALLDIFLALSITLSVLILMTVLFIEKPLDFSSFPSILLITALLRLSLNIASTRLILSEGHNGPEAAGGVINAFGGFVMAGNVVIGFIVFGILTIINFVVITKGSGRVAEVAARFSLDAMPGKQMAIDADLSSGMISEDDARVRRKDLEDESTFFGSMDGANKFVRGDAIAGLMITFINLIGGVIIGMVQQGMEFGDAIQTYTTLTIGDGLVSQLPALIISTGAGLLVTKAGVKGSADKAVLGQLTRYPNAMFIVAGLLSFMGLFMPGIPPQYFLPVAAIAAYIGWTIKALQKIESETEVAAKGEAAAEAAPSTDESDIATALSMDSLRLELGYGLLTLINYEKGHRLTEQIKALRKQLARELGFVMPSVRIQDNMQLGANQYVIKVKEIEAGTGSIRSDMLLVMNPTGEKIALAGEATTEPTFGLPAMWISESQREDALFKNYTVVDPPTVITTHITEIIKENVADLLTYSEVQKLLEDIPKEFKKMVDDIVPSQITISAVKAILQNLLGEQVSIRDLPTIIEAVSEAVSATKSTTLLTEHARLRLARQICHDNLGAEGYIPMLALSPTWEKAFGESIVQLANGEQQLAMQPSKMQEFISVLKQTYDQFGMQGQNPVLLTSPGVRPFVRSIVERFRASTVVMSQNEVYSKAKIKTLGQL